MRRCLVLLLTLLLAAVVSAQTTPRKLILPGFASTSNNHCLLDPANTLLCWTFPAEETITNATKLAGYLTSGSGSATCSLALYPNADGGTAIAIHTGTCANPFGSSGLTPFSLTGGTLYRLCACASTSGVVYAGVQQAVSCCQNFNVTQLVQAFNPTFVGTAANSCTSGVAPATTGAITADATSPGRNAPQFPLAVVEQ